MSEMFTPKKKQFVKEYLIDLNATGAAIRAGYSQKTAKAQGSRLLTDVDVQDSLSESLKAREKRTEITADYVLTSLKNIAERCQQLEPVRDNKGNPTGEFRFDSTGANKAVELLGKNLKLFTDRIDLRVIRTLDDLTDDEQEALLADLEKRLGQ